jgi:oligopeptide transport system substrate-binding protein
MISKKTLFIPFILIISFRCTQNTPENTLRLSNGTEPESLDPHYCSSVSCFRILSGLFEGLTLRGHNQTEVRPGVAAKWEIAEDKMNYTFHLRNTKWSDGTKVTAMDFVQSWHRLADPKTASPYSFLLSHVSNFASIQNQALPAESLGVKAINDSTLSVSLSAPQSYFLDIVSLEPTFPLPISNFTLDKDWTNPQKIQSNGPYILQKWEQHSQIVLEKNSLYWDVKEKQIQKIIFYPNENSQTELMMYMAGQIDWLFHLPSAKIKYWQDNSEFNSSPKFGLEFYRFNTKKPPFNNSKVRKAFSLAIDRKKLVSYVLKGGQKTATQFIPPGISWLPEQKNLSSSITNAKKNLQTSGVDIQKYSPIEILYNQSGNNKKVAEAIGQMWEKHLGVKVVLKNYEWKVYLDAMSKLNYTVARSSWIGDYPDPSTFTDLFLTGNPNNRTGWSHNSYDSLASLASQALTFNQKIPLFRAMDSLIISESPIAPLFYYKNIELRKPRITNTGKSLLGLYSLKDIRLLK